MFKLAQHGVSRPAFDSKAHKEGQPDIVDEDFWSLVPLVWDYTALPIPVLFNLYSSIRYIINAGIKGDFVECGVFMGGSIMFMEYVLNNHEPSGDRRVFALDTFAGFTARNEELDVDIKTGVAVCHPQAQPRDFSGGAIENMQSVGFDRLEVVKGDVLSTIPTLGTKEIALLRLDTDTYETTKFELEHLYDRVPVGGVVIIDDYGYTFGCKKAVDDYVACKPVLLQRINKNCRCWVKTV